MGLAAPIRSLKPPGRFVPTQGDKDPSAMRRNRPSALRRGRAQLSGSDLATRPVSAADFARPASSRGAGPRRSPMIPADRPAQEEWQSTTRQSAPEVWLRVDQCPASRPSTRPGRRRLPLREAANAILAERQSGIASRPTASGRWAVDRPTERWQQIRGWLDRPDPWADPGIRVDHRNPKCPARRSARVMRAKVAEPTERPDVELVPNSPSEWSRTQHRVRRECTRAGYAGHETTGTADTRWPGSPEQMR